LDTPLTVCSVAATTPPTGLPTPPSKPPPEPLETFADEPELLEMSGFIESPMPSLAVARVKQLIPGTIFFMPFQKLLFRALLLERDF
jgi:hypothetical protein